MDLNPIVCQDSLLNIHLEVMMENGIQTPTDGPEKLSRSKIIKHDVRTMIKDDLIGASDWKRSKLGAITGFSIAARSMSSMSSSLAQGSKHIGGLIGNLTVREDLPELPDSLQNAKAAQKFEAAMEIHGTTERDISTSLRNTYWNTYLYLSLSAINVAIALWSIVSHPPHDVMMFVIRFGPLPFLLALLIKHSFTNWMYRHRVLGRFSEFIRSGQYLPRK